MKYEKVVAIDLETTGFSKEKHQILEFGAVAYFPKTEEQRRFSCLVLVDDIPGNITALTGIDKETLTLEGAKPLCEALKEFENFVKEDAAKIIIVGQNIRHFDIPFLVFNGGVDWRKNPPFYVVWDTCQFEIMNGGKGLRDLHALCVKYKVAHNKRAHRALFDAEKAFYVFLKQYTKNKQGVNFTKA